MGYNLITLIGLGLFDEKDLTLRGLEEAKKADKVFIELYTGKWHGNLENLEKLIGKKIEILSRKDLEENSSKLLELAKTQNIAILVQGDPLIATTHIALIQDARKLGIEARIIHSSSILSAIGETGLHIYRFGASVTIPFPEKTKGKLPESVYDVIKMNKARNLHTLCLLDVIGEEEKYMSPKEAVKILLDMENKRKDGVFTQETEVVVFARAGSDKPLIVYAKAKDIIDRDFGDPPAVLIVPGELHFTEKEYLAN